MSFILQPSLFILAQSAEDILKESGIKAEYVHQHPEAETSGP